MANPKPPIKSSEDTGASTPARRRFQRLRTVFILGAIVWLGAIGCLIFELRIGAQQTSAIESLGDVAGIQKTWSGRIQGVHLKGASDKDLAALIALKLPNLRVLQLTDSSLTPQGVQQISSFQRLYELSLRRTPLETSAIDTISSLKTLRKLDVADTGLEFPQIRQLEEAIPGIRIVD